LLYFASVHNCSSLLGFYTVAGQSHHVMYDTLQRRWCRKCSGWWPCPLVGWTAET